MAVNRRRFLKVAGLTALGVAGKPCVDLIAPGEALMASSAKHEAKAGGKRWAMVINLKACNEHKDCTKCMDACHQSHYVPDFGPDNKKDEVKWIWQEPFHHAFPNQDHRFVKDEIKAMPMLVLCNHCDNPPCVRVCPTQATFRREDGIVMMDYHRCIGCRYCVAACPYGSRSFNWRDPRPHIKKDLDPELPTFPTRSRGVVEKCNFCTEQLARGKMPVCVEACEAKALTFGDLEDAESDVRKLLAENYSIRRKPELGTNPEVYYIV